MNNFHINQRVNLDRKRFSNGVNPKGLKKDGYDAIEAIACCLTVKENVIPPTINFETPDPNCDIDCVPNKARVKRVNIALNNGFAFGGNNSYLVVGKFTETEIKII